MSVTEKTSRIVCCLLECDHLHDQPFSEIVSGVRLGYAMTPAFITDDPDYQRLLTKWVPEQRLQVSQRLVRVHHYIPKSKRATIE